MKRKIFHVFLLNHKQQFISLHRSFHKCLAHCKQEQSNIERENIEFDAKLKFEREFLLKMQSDVEYVEKQHKEHAQKVQDLEYQIKSLEDKKLQLLEKLKSPEESNSIENTELKNIETKLWGLVTEKNLWKEKHLHLLQHFTQYMLNNNNNNADNTSEHKDKTRRKMVEKLSVKVAATIISTLIVRKFLCLVPVTALTVRSCIVAQR